MAGSVSGEALSDLDDFNAMVKCRWEDRFKVTPGRFSGTYVEDGEGRHVCDCLCPQDADVIARALNRFFTEMWRYEPREDEDLDSKFGRGSE